MSEIEKRFVVRCRYVANAGQPAGTGYLDNEARCTRDVRHAQTFAIEDDAWTFAAMSGEQVPEDAWVEAFEPRLGSYFDLRSKALTSEALEILLGETVTEVDDQELDAAQPGKTIE